MNAYTGELLYVIIIHQILYYPADYNVKIFLLHSIFKVYKITKCSHSKKNLIVEQIKIKGLMGDFEF